MRTGDMGPPCIMVPPELGGSGFRARGGGALVMGEEANFDESQAGVEVGDGEVSEVGDETSVSLGSSCSANLKSNICPPPGAAMSVLFLSGRGCSAAID